MKRTLLFIFTFLISFSLLACGKTSRNETDDFDTTVDAFTKEYIKTTITPQIDEDKYSIQNSILGRVKAVIVELGEQVWFESGEELQENISGKAEIGRSFKGFSVKYIKFFSDTADSPHNFGLSGSKLDFFGSDNAASYLISKNDRESSSDGYDDIILIGSEYSNSLNKGEMYLLFMDVVSVLPKVIVSGEAYEAFCYTPLCYEGTKGSEPLLIPLRDGKTEFPAGLTNLFSSVSTSQDIISQLSEINKKLILLDRNDTLFENGMTIEELESFFYISNRYDTFAPLFEK